MLSQVQKSLICSLVAISACVQRDIPSLFAELVPTMLEGESLGPIINGRSVHFIDLTEKRGGTQIIPQTSVRHILIQTSEIMT